MKDVAIVGIDIVKKIFQLHGAAADGSIVFRKKLPRGQLIGFLKKLPNCIVAMEACATGHHWGREIQTLGYEVRLIPPIYVKPFVKRQKNDANDAEAISEAAARPTMRFVQVKTADDQARASLFRSRALLVGQRTQLLNALRGHLAEYGLVAPEGAAKVVPMVRNLAAASEDLSSAIHLLAQSFLAQTMALTDAIAELERHLKSQAKSCDPTPADHAGHRSDDSRRHRCLCATSRNIPEWPQFCGLGGARPASTFDGW